MKCPLVSDGKLLAVSFSRTVVLYNAEWEEVWRIEDHRSTVSALAWSGNQLVTACYGQVRFVDALSGNVNQQLEWQFSCFDGAQPDGDVVACGSQDKTVIFGVALLVKIR